MARPQYKHLDLIMAYFVAILIVSNIASSAKIVDLGISLFGLRLSFDGGTILFPLSYIFGDVLTEVYGFRASRRVIWTGFIALGLSSLVFFALKSLPGEAGWESYAGSAAYLSILGGMSSGGIALASLLAYWVGEFTNSAILSRMKLATGGRFLWARTIGSTLAGQLVDTLAFALVATSLGVFPWAIFISLVVSNYIFKCLIEILMTPATYLAVNKLKAAEGIDTYDVGVSLNPFT
ncbi:queuosine precursor transporter [Treponema sp.]